MTALNAATNQAWQLTDNTIGSWAAFVGRRLRITTAGTNNNAITWIAKDLGAQVARVSNVGTVGPMVGAAFSSTAYVNKTPVVNDTYVIEQLPVITLGVVQVRAQAANTFRYGTFLFGELQTRAGLIVNFTTVVAIARIYGAHLVGWFITSNATLLNSRFQNSLSIGGGQRVDVVAGEFDGAALGGLGGLCLLSQAPLFQGVPITGNNVLITSAQIFDCAITGSNPGGHALIVGKSLANQNGIISMSPLPADIASLSLFGSGNTGVGVFVPAGCKFVYPPGSAFTLTGTAGDFKLDNGAQSRAVDPATGVATALINNTWALLATTIGGGGFGNNAHNLTSDAHIVLAANS